MREPIRVLIADDHTIVRDGIRLIIEREPDLVLVGDATDGAEALAKIRQTQPDVALLDINMPQLSGLEVARVVEAEKLSTKVVILSMHDRSSFLFAAIDAGALGYLLKQSTAADLLAAIRAVAAGEAFLHPALARQLIAKQRNDQVESDTAGGYEILSEREREVYHCIISGMSSSEIAEHLTISPGTVQTHRMHIFDKLKLSTTAELVRHAIRVGVIEP